MTVLVITAVILGILTGRLELLGPFTETVNALSSYLLWAMLFVVGVGLGQNKDIWHKLVQMGWRIVMIPLAVLVGSLGGSALAGWLLKMPLYKAMTVGAGLGWYSIVGPLLGEMGDVELGVVALLSNAFREVIALLIIPFVASKAGKIAALAPGGATTMDTTMPLISQSCGNHIAFLGFISGLILTALVPVLVPLIYQLG